MENLEEVLDKDLAKLEFYKIIDMLKEECSYSMSREKIGRLKPFKDIDDAKEALAETSEAVDILRLYPTFSLGPVRDIGEALKRVELGGALNVQELLAVGDTCRAIRMTKAEVSQMKGNLPNFTRMTQALGHFKTVETAIDNAISPEGIVLDSASERLYSIRRKISNRQGQIKERLDAFLHNPNTAKYLQEPIITMRQDRYVVPVKSEYRSQVAGAVHDTSSSGATLFIEPMGVMEANNDLVKLRIEEQDEIAVILRSLSMVVGNFGEDLARCLNIMIELDIILSKGRFANRLNCEMPILNSLHDINLKKARHPLIQGNVVPIDVVLPSNLHTMVITGPNTGGKTVTLKTVGLITLMAMSGLFIPAEHGSKVAFFDRVFADIGDEQSIEQSLSTFSAHMKNIVRILNEADKDSLVLMDELGSGTDPTEGAALAMSILEDLADRKVKALATTHYSELKSFAYNQEGFINASVEFNVETLSPTYRLLIGVPGKSNAFEIANKLGLSRNIVDRANTFISADEVQVADMIAQLEKDRRDAENARIESELAAARIIEQERKLKQAEIDLANKEADIMAKANKESLALIKKTKAECDVLYEEMREHLKNAGATGKEVHKTREKVKNMQQRLENSVPQHQYEGEVPTQLEKGQYVDIPKLKQKGQILSLPDNNGNVLVQVGIMKITLKVKDLRTNEKFEEEEKQQAVKSVRTKKVMNIKPEVDVRGCTVEEAMAEIDKYLDDAFLAGIKQARIIHGKGTGALRQALTPYLKHHRLVEETRVGDFHEGGVGCTVVTLKD